MQASLALPSIGGDVSETFSASPNSPVMAFCRARGWTLTAKVAPNALSWIGITGIEKAFNREERKGGAKHAKKVDQGEALNL
jgi:hypothetical protein